MVDRSYFQGENMPDVTDHTQLALAIGEMRGQVREMVHTQNNMVMKVEAMSVLVMAQANLPDTVSDMAVRIAALEKTGNLRDGRDGIVAAVFRSPSFGWFVGFVATVVAWATGKLDI